MDTRSKIVSASGGALPGQGTTVRGYFDPLTVAHVRRLEELAAGGPVTILLDTPQSPLLPAGARAELLAALRSVELVIIDGEAGAASTVVDEREADLARTRQLMEHVKQRQNAARG